MEKVISPEQRSIKDMSLPELVEELKRAKAELKLLPNSTFWPRRILEIRAEMNEGE